MFYFEEKGQLKGVSKKSNVPILAVEKTEKEVRSMIGLDGLESDREAKKGEVYRQYAQVSTLHVDGYGGGIDNILKLDAVYRLSVMAGSKTVSFFNEDGIDNVVSVDDAKAIILKLFDSYNLMTAERNGLLREVEKATDKAELEVITWKDKYKIKKGGK